MELKLKLIDAEKFHDEAKALPVPVFAFGMCTDDCPDVILMYEELEEAA